jgi:hypothetical protein
MALDKKHVLALPGWLSSVDFDLFGWFLTQQAESGDLLEIGVFKGQSAVAIGAHQRNGERFTICDIFERSDYEGLKRKEFETNYLRFHPQLPVIVDDTSLNIRDHVEAASCRFIHIDGSHIYEIVKADIGSTIELTKPGAIIALDDYRSLHTPGVAAAAWAACAENRLFPICASEVKLYATIEPNSMLVDRLGSWLDSKNLRHERQEVLGTEMFWVSAPPRPRISVVSEIVVSGLRGRYFRFRAPR